jgi:hypothetical protein
MRDNSGRQRRPARLQFVQGCRCALFGPAAPAAAPARQTSRWRQSGPSPPPPQFVSIAPALCDSLGLAPGFHSGAPMASADCCSLFLRAPVSLVTINQIKSGPRRWSLAAGARKRAVPAQLPARRRAAAAAILAGRYSKFAGWPLCGQSVNAAARRRPAIGNIDRPDRTGLAMCHVDKVVIVVVLRLWRRNGAACAPASAS